MDAKQNGKILRRLRGCDKVDDIAREINVAPKTYRAYESGERSPSDMVKIRIAHYFGKTVGELFFGETTINSN